MALIASPFQNPAAGSVAPYVEWSMRVVHPGQDFLAARYSGGSSATGRGPGHYAGQCAWQPRTADAQRRLDRFFQDIQGFVNTTRLQLPRRYHPQVSGATHGTITVASSSIVPADPSVEVVLSVVGGADPMIVAGDYVNIGDRLYLVWQGTNAGGSDRIKVTPLVLPGDAAIVNRLTPSVLVRASSRGQGALVTQGWRQGRAVFEWREVV